MASFEKPQPTEAQTQKAILDWLAAERIWHIRLNTGAMKGSYKGKNWFVRFGKPGMADILAVPRKLHVHHEGQAPYELIVDKCLPIWIEVKRPHTEQTVEQSRFQDEVIAAGMGYMVARSLDDVIAALK